MADEFPHWYVVLTDMGNVIYHSGRKDAAERVAEKYGRSITPLYEHPRTISPEELKRGIAAVQEWLEWCAQHGEEFEPRSGALNCLRAIGIEVRNAN